MKSWLPFGLERNSSRNQHNILLEMFLWSEAPRFSFSPVASIAFQVLIGRSWIQILFRSARIHNMNAMDCSDDFIFLYTHHPLGKSLLPMPSVGRCKLGMLTVYYDWSIAKSTYPIPLFMFRWLARTQITWWKSVPNHSIVSGLVSLPETSEVF